MLQNFLVHFQRLLIVPGNSMRHGRDMKRKKTSQPRDHLDARLALAFVAGFAMLADMQRRAGIDADHPAVREAAANLVASLKRQHGRKVRARALRRRGEWRKADVPNLLALQGDTLEATAREIGRVHGSDRKGRGVVPAPKPLEQALAEALGSAFRMVDPATPRNERRERHRKTSPWFPRLIEAACRGELKRQRLLHNGTSEPHRYLSEIAQEKVAEAAGMTRSAVHQLSQRVRDERKIRKKRALQRAKRFPPALGCGVEPDPLMTAADLKRHLRQLP